MRSCHQKRINLHQIRGRTIFAPALTVLTMHTESHYILQGVRAGAKGVVLKTHASEDLVRAIREASRGGTYMSSQVSSALVQAYQGKTELRPDPLSPRERQVQLIAEGKTTKEVATFLQISVKTSEMHRTRIMTKLNRRGKPSKSGRNLTIFSKYLRAGTPTRRHALGRLPTPPPLPENLLLGLHRKLLSAPPASTQEVSESENRPATRGTAHSEVQGDERGNERDK